METQTDAIERNPMISINVKVWKWLAVIFAPSEHKWRVYAFVLPVCIMNIMQFLYLIQIWDNLASFILNLFFWAAIFDALLRTCIVIYNRDQFEQFIKDFVYLYNEIQVSIQSQVYKFHVKVYVCHSRIVMILLVKRF